MVDCPFDPGAGENGFYLGAEHQSFRIDIVIERLDPDPVPCDEEAVVSCVKNGKRKHSAKVVEAIDAMVFVEMKYALGVGH